MKKKAKEKKLKLSLRRILSDNLFLLELIHKASPGLLAAAVITISMSSVMEFVSGTLILRYVLNGINQGKGFKQIAATVGIWMILAVIMTCLNVIYNQYFYKVRILEVKKNIHAMVYKKAGEVELGCYENPAYYDKFAKAIEECASRADALIESIRDVLFVSISVVLNFTLVVMVDPIFFLFVMFAAVCNLLYLKFNRIKYQQKMEMTEENRRKDYSRRVFYLADYAKEMRLSAMPQLMMERFAQSGERMVKIIRKHGMSIAALGYLITDINEVITALGATLYAVWQTMVTKRMGYGDCLVIVNAINYLVSVIEQSTSVFLQFQEHALYIENLREFLDYEPKLKSGSQRIPAEGDLILKNVSFQYDEAQEKTLKNITMHFGAKEKVAIVGHNGAGKTTLVKLLLRLYDGEGEITYGGEEIKHYPLSEYRGMFSAVMQDYHVFALTVAENVLMDERKGTEESLINHALEKSGMAAKVNSYAKGINTIMTREFDEAGEQLSGGEQQKLAISHVYTKQNRFVILDEPSSALDPVAEYEMYNRMMEACRDCGMIFISHRLSSAVLADRIYLMENGEVIESGSHGELMKKNGKYAEMFRSQAENYAEVKHE